MLVSNIGVPGPEEKKQQYQDSTNRRRLYVRNFYLKNAHVLANRKYPDIAFKERIPQIGKDHTLTPTMAVVLFNINIEEWRRSKGITELARRLLLDVLLC
ncbi:hypothetical protein OESDEN_05527 [Oesophagostomum dentatum]|uniref:Uncharacterized protein n=1 Tax=Oesophagostomum dentatum TaxID=61180 RepID=A0A0B1TEK1_OESDE|nr:hypothetical protein OESDEN_05527 [Oesophagostomum dentatum]